MIAPAAPAAAGTLELVTLRIARQWFGIPVARVREVLGPQRITPVARAAAGVAGLVNLRSLVATALDLRVPLGLPPADASCMHAVVADDGELFSLLVDEVGDVLVFDAAAVEPPPPTLEARWRALATGIVRREDDLLLLVDLDAALAPDGAARGTARA